MKGWVTVNTDAGYFKFDKVGSFAYWIKGDNLFLKGSGLLKSQPNNAREAEFMAVINALEILKRSVHDPILKFVFNRDNIYVRSGKRGNKFQRAVYDYLRYFKKDAEQRAGYKALLVYKGDYAEFRHVKAHTGADDKRSYVNEWCDKQCKARLREWLDDHKKKQFEAR